MKFRDGISIIVTVYNKEQFISKTLDAITQQMGKNSQLIVINDGSTDKSELAIKKFIRSQSKDFSRKRNPLILGYNCLIQKVYYLWHIKKIPKSINE